MYSAVPLSSALYSVPFWACAVALVSVLPKFGTSPLWTAGLEAIPVDQYEAARVDGAGTWQQFWHITWPELQTTLALTLILSLLNAFKVFREAYLVSGRYPQQSIYLLQHLFNNWFLSLDLPRLAAAAVLVALVLLVVILGLLKWWDHCAKDE